MKPAHRLDEQDGAEALRGHLVEVAVKARSRHGPAIDMAAIERILTDRELVRFPTSLRFDAEPLQPGEFAWARPLGERATDGFELVVHPHFEGREEDLPLLVAYHLVSINYLDVAACEEAELFGATLLGLDVDDYYARICSLADELG